MRRGWFTAVLLIIHLIIMAIILTDMRPGLPWHLIGGGVVGVGAGDITAGGTEATTVVGAEAEGGMVVVGMVAATVVGIGKIRERRHA